MARGRSGRQTEIERDTIHTEQPRFTQSSSIRGTVSSHVQALCTSPVILGALSLSFFSLLLLCSYKQAVFLTAHKSLRATDTENRSPGYDQGRAHGQHPVPLCWLRCCWCLKKWQQRRTQSAPAQRQFVYLCILLYATSGSLFRP